jgi:uncharacterized protein
MSAQLEHRRSAIAFARRLDVINPDKIVVWGYSMSAKALSATGTDPRVASAILRCPLLDGRWRYNRGLRAQPRNAAWIAAQVIKAIIVSNTVVPVAAQTGSRGVRP